MRVTDVTKIVLEHRLGLSPSQIETFGALQTALEEMFRAKMGAREIAVALQDIGPSVPNEVKKFQPFAFAALYFNDELFTAFVKGDQWAIDEATHRE